MTGDSGTIRTPSEELGCGGTPQISKMIVVGCAEKLHGHPTI